MPTPVDAAPIASVDLDAFNAALPVETLLDAEVRHDEARERLARSAQLENADIMRRARAL